MTYHPSVSTTIGRWRRPSLRYKTSGRLSMMWLSLTMLQKTCGACSGNPALLWGERDFL